MSVDQDEFTPWALRLGLTPAELDALAERHQKAIDAALLEAGRPDLIAGVPVGGDLTVEQRADKALAWRADAVAIGAIGIDLIPCCECWVADLEDLCPGVTVEHGRAAERHR